MVDGLLYVRKPWRVLFMYLGISSFLHRRNFGVSKIVLCVVLWRILGNFDSEKLL